MERCEDQACGQAIGDVHLHVDRAAHRAHTHSVAFDDLKLRGVGRTHLNGVTRPDGRGIARGLRTGVVRIENPTRGQAKRELLAECLSRRTMDDGREGGRRVAVQARLPQPAVQELSARMVFVRAGPLQPAAGLESLPAHAAVQGRQRPHLIPELVR